MKYYRLYALKNDDWIEVSKHETLTKVYFKQWLYGLLFWFRETRIRYF